MTSGLYVALSGQIALEKRLNTIANNIANMNTPGFRAEEVKFEQVLAGTGRKGVAFVTQGETYLSRRDGGIQYTGNPLDLAVEGNHWFAIGGPQGPVYTRDGRISISDSGELQSVDGYPILDTGGSGIRIDPAGGAISIGDDGGITQGGRQVGQIGIFDIPPEAKLARFENSGVTSDIPAQPVEDGIGAGVRQGYLESSNINPVSEMARLIEVTRAFENAAAAIGEHENATTEAIRELGSTNGG
ncbi:flagellar basal-body rod protein FlgF [Segnochrobactrum spirostomi]|uniref:Flagellar basal-body rod protein FlgF n=1 Tax=Segnochrobactrum spirostomi TaxID=2608987 RepID=A0A6A7Y2Z8_9HYPH|nr:flagellar basal-body rod protein FlgF [Segnochrobactrum spirostomi]MQT12747.1 flagellar basal-body rod protein FlgF [Segnochrobactrum spirostomi]